MSVDKKSLLLVAIVFLVCAVYIIMGAKDATAHFEPSPQGHCSWDPCSETVDSHCSGPTYTPELEFTKYVICGYELREEKSCICVPSIPEVSVNLTVNPLSGTEPLTSELRAQVSGGATGTIDYSFWWDCSDPTKNPYNASLVCGFLNDPSPGTCTETPGVGYKCLDIEENPKIFNHTYDEAGFYSTKVIVERGTAYPAEDREIVNVLSSAPNSSPTTAITALTPPDYCISGPAITVSWSYSDGDGDPQAAYQVVIDDNADFSSPVVDTGQVFSTSQSYFASLGQNYGQQYFVRVRVWDERGAVSNYSATGSFITNSYPAPNVGFLWSPNPAETGEIIAFTDQTVGNLPIISWYWNFGCVSTPPAPQCQRSSSTMQSPTNLYFVETGLTDPYTVTLTVGDGFYSCSASKLFFVGTKGSAPSWIEVVP